MCTKKGTGRVSIRMIWSAITVLMSTAGISPLFALSVDAVLQATGVSGGVCVTIGRENTGFEAELAGKGTFSVMGLSSAEDQAAAHRASVSSQGVFPLANFMTVSSFENLPFVENLVNLLVVDGQSVDGTLPSEAEIRRVLAYNGAAYMRKKGGTWEVINNDYPADVDDWPFSLHGVDRRPVSDDRRLGPEISGLRWISGEKTENKQDNTYGLRIANGRVYQIRRFHSNNETHLVARDAFSGIMLWHKKLDWKLSVNTGSYITHTNNFASYGDKVYLYPTPNGYLTAFNGETGEIAIEYDNTAYIEGCSECKSNIADPDALLNSTILVQDGTLLQSYKNNLWLLDEATGDIKWTYTEPDPNNWIVSPLISEGRIYALVSGEKPVDQDKEILVKDIICLNLEDKSLIWRTEPFNLRSIGLLGPSDGVLVMQHAANTCPDLENPSGNNDFFVQAFNTSDGSVAWQNCEGVYRGYLFPLEGEVCNLGAWASVDFWDVETGDQTRRYRYASNGGGCCIEVFTPNYHVRGTYLHPRNDLNTTIANTAFRPNCETPIYPSYGNLYSTNTWCGCYWYVPSGEVSSYATPPLDPVPAGARLEPGTGGRFGVVSSFSFSGQGPVVTDWSLNSDINGGSKSKRWDQNDVTGQSDYRALRDISNSDDAVPWYGRATTKEVVAGDITLVAHVHQNRLSASRGGSEIWHFLAGGRISVAPVIFGDLAIFGCHDGYVYAVSISDGSLAWRYLAAPQKSRMVAFGQIESVWPLFGVILHESRIYFVSGRVSTMDHGLFMGALDPLDGREIMRIRGVQYPTTFSQPDRVRGESGFGTFGRKGQTINAPPLLFEDKIRVLGSVSIDPNNPQDQIGGEPTGVKSPNYQDLSRISQTHFGTHRIAYDGAAIRVSTTLPTSYTMGIVDVSGRSRWHASGKGNGTYPLDPAALPAGYYVLYLRDQNGSVLQKNEVLLYR